MDLTILIPSVPGGSSAIREISFLEEEIRPLVGGYEILVGDEGLSGRARPFRCADSSLGSQIRAALATARGEYLLLLGPGDLGTKGWGARLWGARGEGDVCLGGTGPRVKSLLGPWFLKRLTFPFKGPLRPLILARREVWETLIPDGDWDEGRLEIALRALMGGWRVFEAPPERPSRGSNPLPRDLPFLSLRSLWRLYRLRNSIDSADYDHRAYDSLLLPQRYWQRRKFRLVTGWSVGRGPTLDIGCGSSRIFAALDRPIGLDILRNKLRFMRHHRRPLLQGSIFHLPFRDGVFDSVVCIEVIEHIPAGDAPFREMARILRRGGRLVLGTPDYGTFAWPLIERLYHWVIPGGYADEHITRYSLKELTACLARHGLRVEEARYICRADLFVQAYKE